MSQPFVGQVMMFGGNFAPQGWMTCSGQILPISEYETLFNLVGTTYGGDGQTTFGLPDLQGRIPLNQGTGPGLSPRVIGQKAGTESVTLTTAQIPLHTHSVNAVNANANQQAPAGNSIFANEVSTATGGGNAFTYLAGTPASTSPLLAATLNQSGGSTPHENIQPVLAVTYCISLFGIYPSQN
jgi:microcystin-dependent protein